MNHAPYRYFYRNHLLICRPFEEDDGRFQARVAIAAMGGLKTQRQRFLDLDSFATHDEAVAFAHQAGIEWIDENVPLDDAPLAKRIPPT